MSDNINNTQINTHINTLNFLVELKERSFSAFVFVSFFPFFLFFVFFFFFLPQSPVFHLFLVEFMRKQFCISRALFEKAKGLSSNEEDRDNFAFLLEHLG